MGGIVLKAYNKIGVIASLLIVGYLGVSNFNKNNTLFWVFTLSFSFGFLGFILEFISKQKHVKNK